MGEKAKKILNVLFIFFNILNLFSFLSVGNKVWAAPVDTPFSVTACINPAADTFKDSSYKVAPDDLVAVAVYKKSENYSNQLALASIQRGPTWDSPGCKAYKGSFHANFEFPQDSPIFVRAEVKVTKGNETLIASTVEKYPVLDDLAINLNVSKSALKPLSKGVLIRPAGSSGSAANAYDENYVKFRLFPDLNLNRGCTNDTALTCWVGAVWNWSLGAVFILSVGAFVAAGIIYMTSAGDPGRIGTAKKLILGAVSAIGVMILGNFFLTKVIGVPWL